MRAVWPSYGSTASDRHPAEKDTLSFKGDRSFFSNDILAPRDTSLAGAGTWGKARTTPPLQGWMLVISQKSLSALFFISVALRYGSA